MEYPASLILFAVAVAIVELLAGAAVGWWLRGTPETAAATTAAAQATAELDRSKAALARLHELAERVAADVGEHSSRVQEISQELTQASADGAPLDSVVLGTVARIIEANSRMQEQLKSAEVKLQEQAQQIEIHAADAMTDALTSGRNRRAFDAELNGRLAEWNRRRTPLALMMIDVDHFKKFNDTHGHLAGDEVLRNVARNLRQCVRQMDMVARYGGEEFAIIMPAANLHDAEPGAIAAVVHIAKCQIEFQGKTLQVTVSGGLAQAQTDEDAAALIKRADEALYAAKKGGRNRVYVHDGSEVRPAGTTTVAALPAPIDAAAAKPAAPASPTAEPAERKDDQLRTDALTGLPNRTAFCEEVRRRVAEAQRYDSKLSLMLVKLDTLARFANRTNDPTAELAVRTVSQFLSAGMREMDLVARYQSDVFAVLLPGTPLNQAAGVAERLSAAVARCPLRSKDLELHLSVTTGLAELMGGDDSTAILQRAESALEAIAKPAAETGTELALTP